jgi:cell division septum initiation protein DivIVA
MPDQPVPARHTQVEGDSPFDELIAGAAQSAAGASSFTTSFRGYDKDEVDHALAGMSARLRAETDANSLLKERIRRAGDAANAQTREVQQRLQDQLTAAHNDLRAAEARHEAALAAANAKTASAQQKIQALTDELVGASSESADRGQFEEILRVAEDQASQIIRNATVQADRLLEASREEIQSRRKEAQSEVEAILAQADHDAQQVRLRIETELTAHQAQLDREAAHGAEKVAQAEREAGAIRTEAEKGAAAMRALVARETTHARTEAEEAVKELRMRSLEFEESLSRRQDDAQQEFLVLHGQAVAHAERITQDANDQVTASLEHAQRVAAKADDFDRLMRAQAAQIEADAKLRAREQLDRARAKAQKIIETVTTHSQSVLRDAEDRTRQLRWQQHQLNSFMAEVKELIRPETPLGSEFADVTAADGESAEPATADDHAGVVDAVPVDSDGGIDGESFEHHDDAAAVGEERAGDEREGADESADEDENAA